MFSKRKSGNILIFILLFIVSKIAFAQTDSVWSVNGDTLTIINEPVIQKDQVVVYLAKKKKNKRPLYVDNHFFISLIYNNQVDKQHYYDVQPKAEAYIKKLKENTVDGLFYGLYGVGFGYHTNRWIISSTAVMYCFKEHSFDLTSNSYYKKANGYYYGGVRFTPGYRFGQEKWMIFPKAEFGLNVIDRVEGKIISAHDTTTMDGAENGF